MSDEMQNKEATMDKMTMIRRAVIVAVAIAIIGVVVVAVAVYSVERPSFFERYHGLESNFQTLGESGHSDLGCKDCHIDQRGIVIGGMALVGDFYLGLVNRPETPAYIELTSPASSTCLSCHYEDWSHTASRTVELPHPAHLRTAEETRECVECHKWTAHEEEYITRHATMPFSGVCASYGCHAGWVTVDECQTCHHAVTVEGEEWLPTHKDAVQEKGPNACLEICHVPDQCQRCHNTGIRPDFPQMGPESGLKAVESEHIKQDWMDKHGEFAIADDSTCFACHVSVGECQKCHEIRPDSHGLESTWLNRHAELAETEADERGCLTCHERGWCDECHAEFEEMR